MLSLFQRRLSGDMVEPRPAPVKSSEEAEASDPSAKATEAPLAKIDRVTPESGLIRADELPSATEALAELFPPEPQRLEPERAISRLGSRLRFLWPPSARSKAAPAGAIETSSELSFSPATEAPLDVPAGALFSTAEGAADESASETQVPLEAAAEPLAEAPDAVGRDGEADSMEKAEAEAPANASGDTEAGISQFAEASAELASTETAESGISAAEMESPGLPSHGHPFILERAVTESAAENASLTPENSTADPVPTGRPTAAAETAPRAQDPETTPAAAAAERSPAAFSVPASDWAFEEKLAMHREWLESQGMAGKKADLAGEELEGHELISVYLRFADLHDANLRAADLLLADLRDACLVRADLEDSCLVGANLEGANLEGATLETAMGLVPRQVAGANLRDALLPPHIMEFEATARFDRASRTAFWYFAPLMGASLLSWLAIWRTKDVQLLTDSAVIPLLHARAAAALPIAESYLLVPLLLFVLYLVFHFHLQRLWNATLELPAVFPDGHALEDGAAGIVGGLLRAHFRWINQEDSSTLLLEKCVSISLAYWVIPVTLLLFWARYLTLQEIHGTMLQVLLVVIATGIALRATTKTGRPQERWACGRKWTERFAEKLKGVHTAVAAAGLGAVLVFVSAGTIAGVPHDRNRTPQYGPVNIRRWAPDVLWALGFDPYADLTEASISTGPSNGTGAPVTDDQLVQARGAHLNNVKFRYAQAYGIFLANAHLWRADFEGAFLSDADLRGADLGQSRLRFAIADGARMNHANLNRADLEGIDLSRADLREANLSYASLASATLVDARLDGAILYSARLSGANLARANLSGTDLRGAYLGGAHLDHADLRGAYLWSAKLPGADLGGAQLGNAILIGADLRGANLGGAQFSGTVLNETDLSGTSLEGADLRGALGLTASQVCSARSRRGAVLDFALQTEVDAQCGK
jgi:uncharacterized protein YjbI with pentapeptide repeats